MAARHAIAAVLLLSLSIIHPARADSGPFAAVELRDMCVSTSDVDAGYCAGYVSAIAHAMLTQNIFGHRACNHGGVRSQQLVDTFTAWTQMFPERLNTDANAAVAAALARAFPCH